MDFRKPVEAVIPGVQGRILAVLAQTTAPLNLRTVARLAGVSPAQVSRVLPELVELGVVERAEVPPSSLFHLVDGNVAADLIRQLADVRRLTLDALCRRADTLQPAAASVVLYGSMATGEADASSDIDILIVRADDVDPDDDRWIDAIDRLRVDGRRLSGNPLSILEVSEGELRRRVKSRAPLWRDIAQHGILLAGRPLAELSHRRSA